MATIDPRKLDQVLNGMGFARKPARPLTVQQLDSAAGILGQLASEDHEELTAQLRDEIGHVIDALERIADRRRRR